MADTFKKISSEASGYVRSTVSISIGVTGTVIWYDQAEDGFEMDVTSNIAASTEIWGDGNIQNGCAPGFPCSSDADDVLLSGSVILLEDNVDLTSTDHYYGGGDCIKASWPIAVTRGEYPQTPGSLLAGAVEVLDTTKWGTYFETPLGQDLASNENAFQYVGMYVMAKQDGTTVVWKNKSGTAMETNAVTLAQGESFSRRVNVGDSMESNYPVQVDVLAGDVDSTYEMRWYSLLPVDKWSKTYLTAVGDDVGETVCVVYNPTDTEVTVTYNIGADGPDKTLVIPSKSSKISDVINTGKAGYFSAPENVIVFSVTDTVDTGMIFDWGYPVQPFDSLTAQVLVGWAYGCTGNTCTAHSGEDQARSVVWIAPTEDAICQVDYDNDGDIDVSYHIRKYVSTHIVDESDQDMSGAKIVCKDAWPSGNPVPFAAAWGQDPDRSFSGDNDALDMGTAVMPYVTCYTKNFMVSIDENTVAYFNRTQNVGDETACDGIPPGGFEDSPPVICVNDNCDETCEDDCDEVTFYVPPKAGGMGGDPHIKRWNRKSFEFHGECDLVLVHSDHVNGHKKLDVHLRTVIREWWSHIESAAMRVGDVVFEITTDKFFVDGKEYSDDDLPMKTSEFTISERIIGAGLSEEVRGDGSDVLKTYNVLLNDRSVVTFKLLGEFLNVGVKGSKWDFGESVGLMGDYHLGKPYDRAGNRMFDLNDFAHEWQVDPSVDPKLFMETKGPQLPEERCRMPTVSKPSRRLRSGGDTLRAQKACAGKDEYEACMTDVIATGNVAMAQVHE
jgi:hypothetical protein